MVTFANAVRAAMVAAPLALLVACGGGGEPLVAQQPQAVEIADPVDGTGFIGKGDVQLALGFNNKQLQDAANALEFRMSAVVVTEVSWVCTNSNNQNSQERERTTTTTVGGLITAVERVKNQITGFKLIGREGTESSSSETEGNPLNSCPSGPWTLTTPAGDPEEISSSPLVEVRTGGTTPGTWTPLQ
jgi:hypothetical protein